jgi:uncharacterized membrane protein YhaH (DUF805 family)
MNYPLLDAFWTMLFLFFWILWLFLVVRIIFSIFRSHDLTGWGKAGWLVLVILVPFIGVLIYVVARGSKLAEDQVTTGGAAQDDRIRAYERWEQRR